MLWPTTTCSDFEAKRARLLRSYHIYRLNSPKMTNRHTYDGIQHVFIRSRYIIGPCDSNYLCRIVPEIVVMLEFWCWSKGGWMMWTYFSERRGKIIYLTSQQLGEHSNIAWQPHFEVFVCTKWSDKGMPPRMHFKLQSYIENLLGGQSLSMCRWA